MHRQAARAMREGEDLADFMDRFVFPGADRREEPRRREGFERYRSH